MNNEDLGLDMQPNIPEEGIKMNYSMTLGFEQATSD